MKRKELSNLYNSKGKKLKKMSKLTLQLDLIFLTIHKCNYLFSMLLSGLGAILLNICSYAFYLGKVIYYKNIKIFFTDVLKYINIYSKFSVGTINNYTYICSKLVKRNYSKEPLWRHVFKYTLLIKNYWKIFLRRKKIVKSTN